MRREKKIFWACLLISILAHTQRCHCHHGLFLSPYQCLSLVEISSFWVENIFFSLHQFRQESMVLVEVTLGPVLLPERVAIALPGPQILARSPLDQRVCQDDIGVRGSLHTVPDPPAGSTESTAGCLVRMEGVDLGLLS